MEQYELMYCAHIWLQSLADFIDSKQGIPWVICKAIGFATVYLDISVYTCKCPKTSESAMNIDVLQTATGGLAGTTEKRRLDWTMQNHTDYIFGNVSRWSRLIGGLRDQERNTRPNFEVQTKVDDERVADF